MKKIIFLFSALLLFICSYGQNNSDNKYFNNNKELGGDVIIKNSTVKIVDNLTYRIFEIESPEDGNFYLSAWLMAAKTDKGYLNYDLQVNNEKQKNKIRPTKSNWQTVELKNKEAKLETVKLKKGINNISFVALAPEIPEVEFIRLTKSKDKVIISDEKYKNFINSIKEEIKERANNPVIITTDRDTSNKISNPGGNYYYHLNVTFKYTTYKSFYFYSGQQVFFTTYASDKYKHVLEVFSKYHPDNYTWSNLSNSNGLASVNVRIPYTGYYYVRVRSYIQNSSGLVDLNVNGQYYYNDCAVSGNGFRNAHETPETYNYFTCKLTGDSRLWISDDTWPGKIIAQNDDYHGTGDFNWGLSSRVKKDFSVRIGAALISSYGSYNPTGKCDLFIRCHQLSTYTTGWWWWQETHTPILEAFPNLKADDAMQSAPQSSAYNCASWGGGRINLGRYFWASNPASSTNANNWYVHGNFWASWDNFFGNNPVRFSGAPSYTRWGATASNAEIAMWYRSDNNRYTHFSVTKPANNQPHGYDWESKPGGMERIFHPKNAVSTSSYGSIRNYYRRNSKSKTYSFEESVALGLTILPDVNLSLDEIDKLDKLKSKISINEMSEFDNKFIALVNKSQSPELIMQSNPVFLYETDEYKNLIEFCKQKRSNILPILFDKVFANSVDESSELAAMLVCELTPEYSSLMDNVKKEWENNNYTKEGAYIAPSPMNNTKNYIKKLLAIQDNNSGNLKNSKTPINNETKIIDSYQVFNVYPNPFSEKTNVNIVLNNENTVSLSVYDLSGKLVDKVLTNELKSAGSYNIKWHAGNLKPGIYLFKLIAGNKVMNRKFLIEE